MTPMMHERVRNMFGDAGLTTGFTVQQLMYDDPATCRRRSWCSGQTAGRISVPISALSITSWSTSSAQR
jgi:hypothetical protein